jgi:hypothetical protein
MAIVLCLLLASLCVIKKVRRTTLFPMRFVNLACRDKKTRDSRKLMPNGVEKDLFNPHPLPL